MRNFILAAVFGFAYFIGPVETSDSYIRADFGISALIVMVVLSAILSVTMALIAPAPDIEKSEPSGLGDFGFPTNLESRYIPVVWGSARVDGQNITWYGDYNAYYLDTGGQPVGYRYSYGLDLALCWGPVDSLNAVEVDDGFIMKANETFAGKTAPAEGLIRGTIASDFYQYTGMIDRGFFGGEKTGGYLAGDMTFYFGTDTQPVSPYLKSKNAGLIDLLGTGNTADYVPKYELLTAQKGICHLIWEGGVLGERPTAPQFKIHISRYPTGLSTAYSRVNTDTVTGQADANPAHVIYEILTDTNWGLNLDPVLIDRQSFLDVAEQLFTEGNGFSYTIQTPKQAKKVIDKVNDQINSTLTQNNEGKFVLKLLRETYLSGESKALLDYKGVLKVTEELRDDSGTGGIFTTTYAGADARFTSTLMWNSLQVGELVAVSNITESSGRKLVKILGKANNGDGTQPFVYFASTTGEDLAANTSFLGANTTVTAERYQQIPEVNQSSIIKMKSASRQSWSETFNVVQVKYLNRFKEFAETIATAHDMGNLAIQSGRKTIKTFDMQGIRSPNTAKVVAQRKLRTHAYPITALGMELNRSFSSLRPGDVMIVNYPDFELTDFVMRVLEVGLPSDAKGNVMVRGMRDVFDESPKTVNVAGITGVLDPDDPDAPPSIGTVNPEINRDAVAASLARIILSGLPYFLHQLLVDAGLLAATGDSTWHIVGAPTDEVSAIQPFEIPSGLSEYVSTSGPKAPAAVGKLVVDSTMIFADNPVSPYVFDSTLFQYGNSFISEPASNSIDLFSSSPYGRYFGGSADPVNFDIEGGGSAYDIGLPHYLSLIAPESSESDYGPRLGELSIRFKIGPDLDRLTQTINEIKEFGFGLALVRPAWANGDSRFDELIAFEEIRQVPLAMYVGPRGGIEGNPQADLVLNSDTIIYQYFYGYLFGPEYKEPERTANFICLDNVYRGVLDTGIQMLNHDSDVFLLPVNDLLYDQVAQTGLSSRSYKHITESAGALLDLTQATAVTVTSPKLNRKDLPLLPKNVRKTAGGDPASKFWGEMDFTPSVIGGEPPSSVVGTTFPAYSESTGYNLTLSHYDPDIAATNLLNVASDTTTARATWRPHLIFHLLQDNADGATEQERKQTAFARWKQGWMPTTPPLRYPEAATIYGYTNPDAVTINDHGAAAELTGFRASAQFQSGSATSISNVNLMSLLDNAATTAGTGLAITAGQKYYIEVWSGIRDFGVNENSYGLQRHIIEWTATTNRTA
jgi:hypothetical protein